MQNKTRFLGEILKMDAKLLYLCHFIFYFMDVKKNNLAEDECLRIAVILKDFLSKIVFFCFYVF